MQYVSTRDTDASPRSVSAAEAIKEGLAPDGGLYLPVTVPRLGDGDFDALCRMDYAGRAAFLLSRFLTGYDPAALQTTHKGIVSLTDKGKSGADGAAKRQSINSLSGITLRRESPPRRRPPS